MTRQFSNLTRVSQKRTKQKRAIWPWIQSLLPIPFPAITGTTLMSDTAILSQKIIHL